jgi:hypothetical protein
MASKPLTEQPLRLPAVDEDGHTALHRWRIAHRMSYKRAAEIIGVSVPTFYRYEAGFNFNMRKANEIVRMTKGEIRYRDLIGNFHPEYA